VLHSIKVQATNTVFTLHDGWGQLEARTWKDGEVSAEDEEEMNKTDGLECVYHLSDSSPESDRNLIVNISLGRADMFTSSDISSNFTTENTSALAQSAL
jgi:hypothetical protein